VSVDIPTAEEAPEDYYKFSDETSGADVEEESTYEDSSVNGSMMESEEAKPEANKLSTAAVFGVQSTQSYSGSGQLGGLAQQSPNSGVYTGDSAGSQFKEVGGGKGVALHMKKRFAKKTLVSPYGRYRSQAPSSMDNSHLDFVENLFQTVQQEPLSTFSIDVDTSSYSQVRAQLIESLLPARGLLRAEEFINYFPYNYAAPKDGKPFSVNVEVTQAPWNEKHQLVRIGLMGKKTPDNKRLANNFVFLVDVSGSMSDQNKLPLVQESLKMLTKTLRENDRVAIVTYAGSTEVVLASTRGNEKSKINAAIDRLNADGSTNGESGIKLAYKIAYENKIENGNNRVILATDGDFNVGDTDEDSIESMVEKKAKKTGVFMTVLGYGMGNYKDSRMQKIALHGNGNNFYIDTRREARKVLIEQGAGTLNAIAKDVKIQVEFHPKHVQSYRLIGYEKRKLNAEDFNDDQKDAGEIGEGHTVTALYEVIPKGVTGTNSIDPLKYQENKAVVTAGSSDELMTVKLRYKAPKSDTSELIEVPVKNTTTPFAKASSDTQFAAAAAAYTMVYRDSKHKGHFDLNKVQELASGNLNVNGKKNDYRAEFVELIKKTRFLKNKNVKEDGEDDVSK
jgi:Ca-activated chloride channel homolog